MSSPSPTFNDKEKLLVRSLDVYAIASQRYRGLKLLGHVERRSLKDFLVSLHFSNVLCSWESPDDCESHTDDEALTSGDDEPTQAASVKPEVLPILNEPFEVTACFGPFEFTFEKDDSTLDKLNVWIDAQSYSKSKGPGTAEKSREALEEALSVGKENSNWKAWKECETSLRINSHWGVEKRSPIPIDWRAFLNRQYSWPESDDVFPGILKFLKDTQKSLKCLIGNQ